MAVVVEKRLHFTKFSINLIITQLNKHIRLHVHRKTGMCSKKTYSSSGCLGPTY